MCLLLTNTFAKAHSTQQKYSHTVDLIKPPTKTYDVLRIILYFSFLKKGNFGENICLQSRRF